MSHDIETELRAAAARNGRPPVARAAGGFVRRALDEGLIDVAYATVGSPVGDLLVAGTNKGLVKISFLGFTTLLVITRCTIRRGSEVRVTKPTTSTFCSQPTSTVVVQVGQ